MLHLAHARCLKVRELNKLNAVYIRFIVDRSRFDVTADSDLDVRVQNHNESLDCVLSRRRLAYFARLARSSCCQMLLGVLSLRLGNSLAFAIQLRSCKSANRCSTSKVSSESRQPRAKLRLGRGATAQSLMYHKSLREQNFQDLRKARKRFQSAARRLDRAERRTDKRLWRGGLPDSLRSVSYAPSQPVSSRALASHQR